MRRRGILRLAEAHMPCLERAVVATGAVDEGEPVTPAMIEVLVRDAATRIGGDHGHAALTSLGLHEGGRSDRPGQARKIAAELMHVSDGHFRQHWEPRLFEQIAQMILGDIHVFQRRLSHLQNDVRTPIGSRLAVEWLSRFETMYAIWTPVSGLGGELTAFRSTLLEKDRPWDRMPDGSGDEGYLQEQQATGCLADAFYYFAKVLWAEHQFKSKFGGLWLLPERSSEDDLANAMYRIRMASPNNGRDDSFLITELGRTPEAELDPFLSWASGDARAAALIDEWYEWASTCGCEWKLGEQKGKEFFPVSPNHPGIQRQCDLHALVGACNDYMLILDDAWDQIADWYHEIPRPPRHSETAEQLLNSRDSTLPKHELNRRTLNN